MQRVALAIFALCFCSAAARLRHARGSYAGKMTPEVVAHTLANVEDKWMQQAITYIACNGTTVCAQDSISEFSKSCQTVVHAIVEASNGDKDNVAEYLTDVCSQRSLEGSKLELCNGLAQAVEQRMSEDEFSNREELNFDGMCRDFLSQGFLKKAAQEDLDQQAQRHQAAAAEEQKKLEEEQKKAAEEKAAEEKRKKDEEAQAKVEAAKQAAEEAERKRAEAEAKAAEAAQKDAEAAAAKTRAEVVANATASDQQATNATTQQASNATDAANTSVPSSPTVNQTVADHAANASDAGTAVAKTNASLVTSLVHKFRAIKLAVSNNTAKVTEVASANKSAS